MTPRWLKRSSEPASPEGDDLGGDELIARAGHAADGPVARRAAHAVATATRAADRAALPALAALLENDAVVTSDDVATTVNLLSAMQFATFLSDDARAGWTPPVPGLLHVLRRGLTSGEAVHEQTQGVLWALADRGLVLAWLPPVVALDLAPLISDAELRRELSQQPGTEGAVSAVRSGHLFPLVA